MHACVYAYKSIAAVFYTVVFQGSLLISIDEAVKAAEVQKFHIDDQSNSHIFSIS